MKSERQQKSKSIESTPTIDDSPLASAQALMAASVMRRSNHQK